MTLRSMLLILFTASFAPAVLTDVRPVLESSQPVVSYRIGDEAFEKSWTLDPTLKPDELVIDLLPGEEEEICMWSGPSKICCRLTIGDSFDFDIRLIGASILQ